MSYLVLARKWRPRQFSEVVAQEHVTRTLENAITQNRLASAYLFTGPRGVGKTTMARLLAKAVNCEHGPTITPCDVCTNCQEITDSRSLDVLEIDGASNRGIDEVRNLRENARYTPTKGTRKIYIIDEVHMLTEPAFNALLKTLEEPPPHVLFIFATTEVHKVPATILSRCQRFDFRRVPLPEIVAQLRMICEKEAIQIDDPSLHLLAKKAEGSMRDSQSLLDQVIAYCGQQVRREEVAQLLGIIDQDLFFACTDAISRRDVGKGLELSDHIYTSGYHLGEFLDRLAEHFSNVLTTRVTNSTAHLFGLDGYVERYKQMAELFTETAILRCVQMITDAQLKLSRVANPRVLLEMLLLQMIQRGPETDSTSTGESEAPPASPKVMATRAAPSTSADAIPQRPGEDGSKKKSSPAGSNVEAITPVDNAEPGLAIIPEIAPAAASIEAGDTRQGEAQGAKSEEREAPPRAQRVVPVSLFDRATLPGMQKVPVVQAKEPTIPRLTNVIDAKEALLKIQQKWSSILEQVKARRISLGTFLELGLPTSLSEGTLEITFDQGNGFQINSVSNQKTFIQEVIKRETGYQVRIICRKDESNSLHTLRVQLQEMTRQHETSAADEMYSPEPAPENLAQMPSGSPVNDVVATAIATPVGRSEQATLPANGASQSPHMDPQQRETASLEQLYQAYPMIRKLVEVLDGELIRV